jgi:putative transposase
MPAFARVVIPGIPYHVTQRGNYRQDVFLAPEDGVVYLNYVASAADAYGLELHGWCLMSNHVHWIVLPLNRNAMAQSFRRAHSRYASYVNRQHKRRSGHLWQGRYYSCPLDDARLSATLLYVERNPARAGLVKSPADYPWSSAAARLGLSPLPRFLHLYRWNCGFTVEEWRQMLDNAADPEAEQALRVSTQQGKPYGEIEFIEAMERKTGRQLRVRTVGRPAIRQEAGD